MAVRQGLVAKIQLAISSIKAHACFSHVLIAATLLAVSFAARAEMTYTITSYPAGLADLPCDAFKKS